jgi:hypothetical protein
VLLKEGRQGKAASLWLGGRAPAEASRWMQGEQAKHRSVPDFFFTSRIICST